MMDKFLIRNVTTAYNCQPTCSKISSSVEKSGLKRIDSRTQYDSLEQEKDDFVLSKSERNKSDMPITKRLCIDSVSESQQKAISFQCTSRDNLNLKYAKIFTKQEADNIFRRLEEEVEYFPDDLVKVKVFGKWHNIPRKQVSFGDPGLSYAFSGTSVPAVPWNKCKIIEELKQIVESITERRFNFVLVNRYKDGLDYIGEHRDDEKDLVQKAPIASLSIGQPRDFVFKHKDARTAKSAQKIAPKTIELEHGSLLLMEWPTNHFWYHSLPIRKKAMNARINLTFREMVIKK